MFLKKIVASGFKSFADRVVINFSRGITGVVGPNGSGKSNVIDAVRWVMGEQNAKNLRGDKATDIIFAGSERRKPLSMAEVSLVFDNSEGSPFCPPEFRHESEISLTRRMYADGQREYMINKKPCRLKDIVGFFAMTGLGGKSYSMIQQGQVDRILNSKPEDIREMLESAAGTIIYKKRKQEATRKLEQTQLNLSRIDDILLEVEKSLESLKNQVEKARKYKEVSERLREEELNLFAHNFHHYRDQEIELRKSIDESNDKAIVTMAEAATLERDHAELQAQLDEADPDMQRLQESISVIREKIASAEATLKSGKDLLQNGDQRLADIAEELSEEDANLKVLERQVESAQTELSSAESVAKDFNEAIDSFASEVDQAEEAARVYQSRIDEFEDEVRNLERLIESNKLKEENLHRDIEKNKGECEQQRERRQILTQELEEARELLTVAEGNAAGKKDGLDKDIREKHDREISVAAAYDKMKVANSHRDQLRERYHEVKGRVTSLAEITAGATDVATVLSSIREAGEDIDSLMIGLFTDFISFKESADEMPPRARAAFERWSERVLVDNLDQFNQFVRLANQHAKGTVPLSILELLEIPDEQAVKTWADRWDAEPMTNYFNVEGSNPALAKVVNRLYLLSSLSLDEEVLRDMPSGVIVFTSQGVAFAGSEEFVFGSKDAEGLLSRKVELEELASELKGMEGQLASAQLEVDQLEIQINDDRAVIAAVDTKLREQNEDVQEVLGALHAAQHQVDRKKEGIEVCDAFIEKQSHNEVTYGEDLVKLSEEREALQIELRNAQDELEGIEEEASSLLERKEEVRRLHEGKKLELAKSEARASALRDSFTSTRSQLQLLQNKLSRKYAERDRVQHDIDRAKVEVVQAESDIGQFLEEREKLDTEFKAKREENAGIIDAVRKIDNDLREKRNEQDKHQRIVNDCNVKLERVLSHTETALEGAMEKYRVDLESYEFERQDNFNIESKTRLVSRLRSKINDMGDINMMALTEYEEKTERHEFMARQRDEVTSSIDLLETAIIEIEETSVRKFMEIFATINAEFGELFPILFPGGEGRLELMEPEKPLDGGVEILCRLPGKSMKAMSLFSGGEKALTAIALIFSMLKTKPTPFCFLDEVDAPLDETNVGRYNRVLEKLASQFQFIVITHNRRTMEVLDQLYGITMQEPGVTKVVGVDMQRDLPPHLRKAFKDSKGGGQEAEGATAH
jgi:chromosome segregation protein